MPYNLLSSIQPILLTWGTLWQNCQIIRTKIKWVTQFFRRISWKHAGNGHFDLSKL